MVRSQNIKYVGNYDFLAQLYDELLIDEEAYELWLKYIREYKKGTVLELASGSAVLSRILKDEGYDILASDISIAMKDSAKKNFDGPYEIIDMRDFKLDKKFDMVLCILDSMNYLNKEELIKVLNNVYEHLNNNGVFIFDMHHKDRLKEFKDLYIEEGIVDDIPYQWTIQSDILNNEINEHFAFYLEDMIVEEAHKQNVFDYDFVKNCLKERGFKVRFIEDFIESEKVLFIGEKV